jgi:hypothetical protein
MSRLLPGTIIKGHNSINLWKIIKFVEKDELVYGSWHSCSSRIVRAGSYVVAHVYGYTGAKNIKNIRTGLYAIGEREYNENAEIIYSPPKFPCKFRQKK